MDTTPDSRTRPTGRGWRGSLFLRIYATFVTAVLGFAVLAGALVWAVTSSWSDERVTALLDPLAAIGEPLATAVAAGDEAAIADLLAGVEAELDAQVLVFPRLRGRRFGPPLGEAALDHPPGPPLHEQPLSRADLVRMRQGLPLVRRRGLAPPTVAVALFEHGFAPATVEDDGERGDEDEIDSPPPRDRVVALVVVEPRQSPRRTLIAAGVLLLLALAGGAWPLARSLSARLAKLERSTQALAGGELSHRAELSHPQPRDEVDALALAFNDMAERLETLVTGQRSLLANVSHELRTPIARAKVLVEILGERVAQLREAEASGRVPDARDLTRLERGFRELEDDLEEVEGLIKDLLTSGRLELGRDSALELASVDVGELCSAAASRFEARVECAPGSSLIGDRMLLDRLLRNLLANARRACPSGDVVIRASREGETVVVEVEDEGTGIPANKRSLIFEPFARLDAARARDEGGVGLGLYLCRQIAAAHHGTIRAEDRRDGRPGARFVIRLPASR